MQTYNRELCEDKHKNISKELEELWKKIARIENWVVIGMGSLIIQLVMMIADRVKMH